MKCTAVKVQAVQTKAGATIALNVGHQKVRGKSMIGWGWGGGMEIRFSHFLDMV